MKTRDFSMTLQGKPEDYEVAICAAVDAGYRHFDTAWAYGSQEVLGRALEKKINEGVIERKDVFITTKVHYLCR